MADPVRAIADAVLYEGYILWPYRRSALKNQRRFTFGGVYPPAHSARHPDDPSVMQAEVLMRGDGPVEVTVRFLQVVERAVLGPDGEPVDERVVGGERFLSWDEAVEREVSGPGPIAIPAASERDGFLVRSWQRLEGQVEVAVAPLAPSLRRVSIIVRNLTPSPDGAPREDALKRTFCSTHMLMRGGEFVSATDPPAEMADQVAKCRNLGCWPVLVESPGGDSVACSPDGEHAARQYGSVMLASPIILEDHPRIAPESPGELFDGGEIDQLLVLNILALTDEEKAEMAASDPRAREILKRTEALTPEQLIALHGRTVLR